MVWFQCEDCGENLKKPKLANHFRGCSAQKLSCIDCGVIFNQQSVQGHTQCVSEAEKYGPKNAGFFKKETMKTSSKENNCDGLDVSLGLSTRAPWSCSLCIVKATSQETLLLHSQGKKHKSKVRSISSKMPNGKNPLCLNMKEDNITVSSNELGETSPLKLKQENGDGDRELGAIHSSQPESEFKSTEGMMMEQTIEKKKKRKLSRDQDRLRIDETQKTEVIVNGSEPCDKLIAEKGTGSVEALKTDHWNSGKHKDTSSKRKRKEAMSVDDGDEAWISLVKWQKLIKRALKNAPSGSLKVKHLRSSLLPSVRDMVKQSAFEVNKAVFSKELERQIRTNAKFIVDGKRVRLAA